jgi:exo-beta-1,3-glucanase (GH17 family)
LNSQSGTTQQTTVASDRAAVAQDASLIQSYSTDQQQLQNAIAQAQAQGPAGQATVSAKEFQLSIVMSLLNAAKTKYQQDQANLRAA